MGGKNLGLKEKRTNVGLTQESVAKVIGTSRVTIARWESGIHEPGFETLRKLAKMYSCSIDDLLNPTRPPPLSKKAARRAGADRKAVNS